MNNENKNAKIVQIQKEKPENQYCIDCNSPNATWASVNNGIFLCLNCAGIHRGLGVQISYIKSLSMDEWEDKQIELMKIGGNERLKNFIKEYDINNDMIIEKKYKLIALDYYRKMLHYEIYGGELIDKPNKEEGLKEINLIKSQNDIDKINNDNFITNCVIKDKGNNEKKKKSFFSFFGDKIKEMNIKDKAYNFGKKAYQFGKIYTLKAKEKTNEIFKTAVGLQKKKKYQNQNLDNNSNNNNKNDNNNNNEEPDFNFFGNNQITSGENTVKDEKDK